MDPYLDGEAVAIKFEDKGEGRGKSLPERAAKAKPRVEASMDESAEAANSSEMPFAKPVRPLKKGRRK